MTASTKWAPGVLLSKLTPKGSNVDRKVVARRRAAAKRARASRKKNR